jgi:hypothetical protein
MPWWRILLIVLGSFCAGVIATGLAILCDLAGDFDW